MNEQSLEQKLAKAKAESAILDDEIANAQAIGANLRKHLGELREVYEKQSRNAAYLIGLYERNKKMEREIARMEGREYRDLDNPDGDWPEPPET